MKKKVCASCGFENDSNKKFCVSCGKNLEEKMIETVFCPECGEKLEEGSLFCASCGTKVTSSEEENILDLVENGEKQEDVEDTMDDSSLDEDVLKETQEKEESMNTKMESVLEIDSSDDIDSTEENEVEETTDASIEETKVKEAEDEENSSEDDITEKEEELAFCPECGERLEKGTSFCVSCGAKIGALEEIEEEDDSSVEEKVVTKNSSKFEEDKKKKHILILILILLLIVILASFYYFFFYKPSHGSKKPEVKNEEKLISVPNVINKTGKEAIGILQELSFEVRIVEEISEDAKKVGLVFEQEPLKGKLKKNSEITIKIYVSKEKVEMVPVTGDTLEEAQEKLNNLGVTIKILEESSDTVEKGKIISQSTQEGEEISKGGTVTIVVSTGKEEENKEESKKPTPTPNSTKTPEVTSNPTSKPTQSEKTPIPNPTSTPGPWSNWSTSLNKGIDNRNYDIETKTQYRSRTKQTTTSASSSLSGWTRYDVKSEPIYSENKTTTVSLANYNSFKNNKNYQIVSEEVTERMIHYAYCRSSDGSKIVAPQQTTKECPSGYTYAVKQETDKYFLDTSLINTHMLRTYKDGTRHESLIVAMDPFTYRITYKEKTGDKNTYYFYKWGAWSAWQDSGIASNDSLEVATRTMYRWRKK